MSESTQHDCDLSLAEQAELLHGLAPVLGLWHRMSGLLCLASL